MGRYALGKRSRPSPDSSSQGVSDFTFVDNGSVSFSNPTRQSLYDHGDCLVQDKKKAIAAADALRRISPSIRAEGSGHASTTLDRRSC